MNTNLAWPGANLPAVTIPWMAMSVAGRKPDQAFMAGDNGEGEAGKQRRRTAFPKGFEALV